MIRNSSPAMLAATAIVSLAVGFGGALLLQPSAAPAQPIVNADAWQETGPSAFAMEAISTTTPAAVEKCDPWKVSDIAMEEVLDEMIRRGWRPPSQGEAVALLDAAQTVSLTATDPSAPMPPRRTWVASQATDAIAVVEEGAIAEPAAPAEATAPPLEPAKPEQPPA
jgi:hypothetical protein